MLSKVETNQANLSSNSNISGSAQQNLDEGGRLEFVRSGRATWKEMALDFKGGLISNIHSSEREVSEPFGSSDQQRSLDNRRG